MGGDGHNGVAEVAEQFRVGAPFLRAEPYGNGHINDTFAATYGRNGASFRTILQRINTGIFKEPEKIIANVERATGHIRAKLEAAGCPEVERRVLTFIPTKGGLDFYRDAKGGYWRSYVFVDDASSHEAVTSPELAYESAKAFGRFQADLADLGGERLHETIPDFHNTPKRFAAFVSAIKADPFGRAEAAKPEIEFILAREKDTGIVQSMLGSGALPERVTHNDTKLNNVLICDRTGEGICVIDLDTVMPGSALYDFGDMVRTATSPEEEDSKNLEGVEMRMPMFEALVEGYLEAAGAMLTPEERELLPFAGKLITLEIGIRFLTDHILGDTYFRIHRPNQNLDRARTQLKLVESIERQMGEMTRAVG